LSALARFKEINDVVQPVNNIG